MFYACFTFKSCHDSIGIDRRPDAKQNFCYYPIYPLFSSNILSIPVYPYSRAYMLYYQWLICPRPEHAWDILHWTYIKQKPMMKWCYIYHVNVLRLPMKKVRQSVKTVIVELFYKFKRLLSYQIRSKYLRNDMQKRKCELNINQVAT